jgi:hypothetical protein
MQLPPILDSHVVPSKEQHLTDARNDEHEGSIAAPGVVVLLVAVQPFSVIGAPCPLHMYQPSAVVSVTPVPEGNVILLPEPIKRMNLSPFDNSVAVGASEQSVLPLSRTTLSEVVEKLPSLI